MVGYLEASSDGGTSEGFEQDVPLGTRFDDLTEGGREGGYYTKQIRKLLHKTNIKRITPDESVARGASQ